MSDTRMIGIIQNGVNSPFWTEYLLPLLQERAKNALTALASKAAEDDDMKRGRFQECQYLINAPLREIEIWNDQERAAQEESAAKDSEEYRATQGYRSPFRQVPDVGELTGNESANTGS